MNWDFLQQNYLGNQLYVYIEFALILLLAIFLKKYIARILARLFFVVLKKKSNSYLSKQFRNLLSQPFQGIILTIAFYFAFLQLDKPLSNIIIWNRARSAAKSGQEISHLVITLMDIIDQLFILCLFFFVTLLIVRSLSFFFLAWMQKAEEEQDKARLQMLPLLKDVLTVTLWIISFFMLLGAVFNVNVAALIAGLGVGGIAIAFAAKESLENLLASFMVMLDKPFAIGDWIKIDNVEGTIEKVGFRSSRIRSFDKSVIILPNRKLIESSLENLSERGLRRVKFTVGAVYGISRENLRQIIKEIKESIQKAPDTVEDPIVYLDSFGDSSVNIIVIYYVVVRDSVDFFGLKQEINLAIYEIMYRLGTGFAFPTQVQIQGEAIDEVSKPKAGK